MSDPRSAFLRAIEQDFDSDIPRLVFADWLDENREPHLARFIRLQCEDYRRSREDPAAFSDIDFTETHQLLTKHGDRWMAGLPRWARKMCGFQRGFPSVDLFTGKQLMDDGAAVRAVTPVGGDISLRRLDGRVAVFWCEHLAAVTGLELPQAQLTDEGVRALVRSPHLRRVETLNLSRGDGPDVNRLTDLSVELLSATPALPALRRLSLDGYRRLTAGGLRALLESPLRAGLTHLSLSDGRGPGFAAAFRSRAVRVKGLEGLELRGRELTDADAETLADSPALGRLTELHLSGNQLTDAGAAVLLRSPHLRAVRTLDLADNPDVTDATARLILSDARPWEWVLLPDGLSIELRTAIRTRCEENR